MSAPIRNYDIAELKRLDLAHHLPAQADHKVIAEQGGSRIITRAEGCVIHDGDGNAILDGMAGLWCVNVGYGRKELADAAYEQMLELPYYNTFFKTATPPAVMLAAKIAEKMGSILATWVWNGSAFTVPSAMSKAGVNVMTQSLAVEWADRGIRFNAIAPGTFPTEGMTARLRPGDDAAMTQTEQPDNPMGRVGRMPELANLAAFLMSPAAEYLNGQTIAIDGARYQATGANFSSLRAWGEEQWAAARDSISTTNAKDRQQRTA